MSYAIVLIGLAVLVILFVAVAYRKHGLSKTDRAVYLSHWKEITTISRRDPARSIMEADKMLDSVLARIGYSGTLGEKLKASKNSFSDLDGIWSAHKLRNRLAHELGAKATDEQAEKALQQFKVAFGDLGLQL
jgi:hypothetical protein